MIDPVRRPCHREQGSVQQLHVTLLAVLVAGCGGSGAGPDGGADATGVDGTCGAACDQDGDGVLDDVDQCPDTSAIGVVNHEGCNDQQVDPVLQPEFPPYGLTWTSEGDPGRAGGLIWTYTGIRRDDLFHIDWVVCDDPATPCGVSLDGPIDVPAENWQFSAADSDLPGGVLVLTNTTQVRLLDTTVVPLSGRVTLTIVNAADAPLAFEEVAALDVVPRLATHAAEILGTGFKVTILGEVDDGTSGWTPYLDYYDAAATADPGDGTTVSIGASFYDE